MAPSPITKADIQGFLTTQADFAFEMRTLNALRALHFDCEHSGTFRDPITEKIRQFDIRARRSQGPYHLRCAVECKNLRLTRPLLVHAVKRVDGEAYHDLAVRSEVPVAALRVKTVARYESAYKPKEFVGKKTDQVARKGHDSFLSSDSEVFDKISQSINSAFDLVQNSLVHMEAYQAHAIVPVLVVPDRTLWQVEYDDDGVIVTEPTQVASTTLFLNHTWRVQVVSQLPPYSLSHLEIVTLDGLRTRIEALLGASGLFALGDSLLAY